MDEFHNIATYKWHKFAKIAKHIFGPAKSIFWILA